MVNLRLPRQYSIYQDCFIIAKNLFLRHSGKKEKISGNRLCGYVVSTERAFECIVESYCRSAAISLGYAHRAQATTPLARAASGSELDYSIIPDDLVFTKDKKLIVDAKYKLLKNDGRLNKPSRDDFYQMISSCIAQNAYEAVLVYPFSEGSRSNTWRIIEKVNGHNYIIRSAFVDVFGAEKALEDDMKKLILKTSFYEVNA